jgi:hypothetical protein
MGKIGCPETSVRNYHYTLRNIPEERRSQVFCGGSLKSSTYNFGLLAIYKYSLEISNFKVVFNKSLFNGRGLIIVRTKAGKNKTMTY